MPGYNGSSTKLDLLVHSLQTRRWLGICPRGGLRWLRGAYYTPWQCWGSCSGAQGVAHGRPTPRPDHQPLSSNALRPKQLRFGDFYPQRKNFSPQTFLRPTAPQASLLEHCAIFKAKMQGSRKVPYEEERRAWEQVALLATYGQLMARIWSAYSLLMVNR